MKIIDKSLRCLIIDKSNYCLLYFKVNEWLVHGGDNIENHLLWIYVLVVLVVPNRYDLYYIDPIL